MNFFQRLAHRLIQAWAVLRGPGAANPRDLPPPLVDPRMPEATLCEQARRQGLADADNFLYDQWSLGVEGDEPSALLDPPYVQALRHRRESAVREHRDRQTLTDDRLAAVRLRRDEAAAMQSAARDRMASVAVRESQHEQMSLHRFLARENIDPGAVALPPPDSQVWEGESTPLGAGWRLLILLFLGGIVFAIQNYVYEFYVDGAELNENATTAFTVATAALTVLGPFLAGLFFRARHATGHDHLLSWLAIVLLLPSVVIVGGFGYLAARLFDRGAAAAGNATGSRSSQLGVVPATLVLVFVVIMLIAGVMSYMLGLARRHPFQEAYVRNREARIGAIAMMQRLGTRINPDFRASSGLDTPDEQAPEDDRELAIVHAYFAAEEAYYEGLQEGFADPTFTEAIVRRRGRRAPEPPPRVPDTHAETPEEPS